MAEEQLTRRSFLKKLTGGVMGITGLIFAVPVIKYLIPHNVGGGANFLTNADGEPISEHEIKEGAAFIGLSKNGPTIVIRYEGKLRALSAVCTHLGCLVKWLPSEEIFFCPCHAGKFDINGANISGPPPEPLEVYAVTIDKDSHIVLERA